MQDFSSSFWKLAGFDLDGTLITGTTTLLHISRQIDRVSTIRNLVEGYESYQLTNYEVATQAAVLFRGFSREGLMGLMNGVPTLWDIRAATGWLRYKGIPSVIATVTFDFASEWFAKEYGFDSYGGIELEYDQQGRATGEVRKHVSEEDKAVFLMNQIRSRNLDPKQTFFVGDSRSDLRCFAISGCAIALNAASAAKGEADISIETDSLLEVLRVVPELVQ